MNKIKILFKKKNGGANRSEESNVSDGQISCEKLSDKAEWQTCGPNASMPELLDQVDHISNLLKSIYDGSQLTIEDK